MTKLFLVSSFTDTYQLFPAFANETLEEKKLVFIDTASHTEERTSYVDKAEEAWKNLGVLVNRIDIFSSDIA
ncbi:Type 1 glutamine amidotransferase-like domain-containing protein, partial [Acinetobacter baumannii]|uniref:Type 1 glutamine amidotransferase-like domain-containing protein n=1 Tax=Acinetobacter baumannii TaxID=470 RepID=UPI001AECBC33